MLNLPVLTWLCITIRFCFVPVQRKKCHDFTALMFQTTVYVEDL
jgi:hypothetical protein